MNPRIDNTQPIQNRYDEQALEPKPTRDKDNNELLVPASYAALGGTFELLMLMLEASKSQKDTARKGGVETDALLSEVQSSQVADIRAKAGLQLAQALVAAPLGVAAAAQQLGSTMSEVKAVELQQRATSLLDQGHADQAQQLSQQAKAETGRAADLTFNSKLTEITGRVSDGGFGSAITNKDADATQHQNRSDALKRSADKLRSELDDLKGNEDKLIAYARDIEASKSRCTQIALQSR